MDGPSGHHPVVFSLDRPPLLIQQFPMEFVRSFVCEIMLGSRPTCD